MMKIVTIALLTTLALTACDKSATEQNLASITPPPTAPSENTNTDSDPHDLQALAAELGKDSNIPETATAKPIITSDGKTQIDWSHIDTKEPKAELASYAYPIALNSQAVKNYAKEYGINDKQAQHSIVVGMAAPEALGKVLDQLQGKYIAHTLTDGADMSLVITTTPDVVGERHDYVFVDNFGKGLMLPIVIKPQSPK